jgi:2-amino-4-hydroxy-6-hydroxymethyldihydropteridine diphosphokinase
MARVTSYIAVGSNLGNRIVNIKESIGYLRENKRIKIKTVSPIHEFPSQGGPKNQPPYLNLALSIQTTLTPLDLLVQLKAIESKLKREKTIKWGPRPIDLDILFYDDLIFINRELSIPHPLLHKRIFVLKPLADIAPDFIHPIYKKNIKNLLKGLRDDCKEVISLN